MKKMVNGDKVAHFVAGAAITGAIAWYVGGDAQYPMMGVKVGLLVCVIVAAAKEAVDANRAGHSSDGGDIVATVVGGLVAAVMML